MLFDNSISVITIHRTSILKRKGFKMAESPLRDNQAVNFRIPGDAKLMHFLADWIELEVSKVFTLSVVMPGNGTPNLVQVVPQGQSAAEDETYFHLLERSLGKGEALEFWKQHAEILPRLQVCAGKKAETALAN